MIKRPHQNLILFSLPKATPLGISLSLSFSEKVSSPGGRCEKQAPIMKSRNESIVKKNYLKEIVERSNDDLRIFDLVVSMRVNQI